MISHQKESQQQYNTPRHHIESQEKSNISSSQKTRSLESYDVEGNMSDSLMFHGFSQTYKPQYQQHGSSKQVVVDMLRSIYSHMINSIG